MSDGALHRYFLSNNNKAIHKWVHYFDIYERHFARFRNKCPVFLEIGVSSGGSLGMWKHYFGEGCRIIGLDIDPECKKHEHENTEIFIGSQSDRTIIETVTQKYPQIDIVLDDGSHLMTDMMATFDLLYEKVNPCGIYAVEDTHTCYWPDFGGGLSVPGSFMQFTKNKMDELNAAHTRGALPITAFTRSTDSITTYDSIVIFERRPQAHRQDPRTGRMA